MSRSNSNIVRNIRENEHLQVRKTILKASGKCNMYTGVFAADPTSPLTWPACLSGSAARQEKIAQAVLAAGDTYADVSEVLSLF